jgi:predicted RNA-binding protein with EMAP domain
MYEVLSEKKEVLARIEKIVENLFNSNSFFQERLEKAEMIKYLVKLFSKFSLKELRAISDDDLTDRIDGVLVIEAVAGTLNDLTPEEMEMFDAAVEGR